MREKSEVGEKKQNKRLIKAVNFTKKDEEIFDKVDKMENYSAYIIDLIKKDMERGGHDKYQTIIDELQEIKTLLKTGNFTVDSTNAPGSGQLKNKMFKALDIIFDEEDN